MYKVWVVVFLFDKYVVMRIEVDMLLSIVGFLVMLKRVLLYGILIEFIY